MNFVNKIAVVAGGTGTLGWEITRELLHGSAQVVILARDAGRFEERLKTVPNMKGHVEFLAADLTSPGETDAAVDRVRRDHGGLHVLVHAAGTPPGPPCPLSDAEASGFGTAWAANVMTAFLTTRAVLSGRDGDQPLRIVHVGTRLGAYADCPQVHVHVACRNAVVALAQGVAREAPRDRVWCNAVLPGLLSTRANRNAFSGLDERFWSKPAEVARAAVLLAAEETENITGAVISV
jgi:NAD(P)-dependent dehydrogenase (short-subunit alcohol dehydrogenase family)